jgi:hypothetical protein
LLASLIVRPPKGAGDEIAIDPVSEAPPATDVGLVVREERVGAFIVNVADAELVPIDAFIAAVAFAETGTVLTLNVALVWPDATMTDAPTVAEALAEDRDTITPSPVAFLEMVTVPEADVPPTTLAGDRLTLATVWAPAELATQAITQIANFCKHRIFLPDARIMENRGYRILVFLSPLRVRVQ